LGNNIYRGITSFMVVPLTEGRGGLS